VRWLYPLVLTLHLLFVFRHSVWDGISNLRQTMIDAEYVVEERVENYDPTAHSAQADQGSPIPRHAEVVDDEDDDQWVDEGEDEEE